MASVCSALIFVTSLLLRNMSTDLLNVGMDGMKNPWRTSVWFELMLDLTSLTSAVCTAAECSRAAKVWLSRHCGRSRRGLSIDWLRGEILKLIRRSLQRLVFVCGLRFSFACVCVCSCSFLNSTGGRIDLVFSTHMAPNVIDFICLIFM